MKKTLPIPNDMLRLLIRRNIADGDTSYFTTWCPLGTSIETLIRIEATDGRSRTASKPPRMNWGSTTTKPVRGMAGIVMSRWLCSLSS
jgi:hypothetical protein